MYVCAYSGICAMKYSTVVETLAFDDNVWLGLKEKLHDLL